MIVLCYTVYLCVCRVFGLHKPQALAHHVLYSTVGTILSQAGDWFGGRSQRQKENNDSSASDSNRTIEAGSNSAVSSFVEGMQLQCC